MTVHYACSRVIEEEDLYDCECKLESIVPPLEESQIGDLLDAACDALARFTNLPIGRCSTQWRPCLEYCHYWGCPCGCSPSGIPLPGISPVVTEVRIDGVVLDSANYATVVGPSGASLERIDGYRWPAAQSVSQPASADNTFAVTVTSGLYPDYIMKHAAAEIACDIISQLDPNHRHTEDGSVSVSAFGQTVNRFRFGDPTDQNTIVVAGYAWVKRFVATVDGLHQTAIISPDELRGWTMYRHQ